jgi:hypothetical protein
MCSDFAQHFTPGPPTLSRQVRQLAKFPQLFMILTFAGQNGRERLGLTQNRRE